jgi:uroporphyrinogen decarboxylase
MQRRERFLAALKRAPVDRPPVWLMRQAGRYLPEYRAVRAVHGFWEVCQTPELSTKVALEPLRKFALDAAIVFSDILVIPQALGAGVSFEKGEGPVFTKTLRTRDDLRGWHTNNLIDRLQFLPNAVKHLSHALENQWGLLGFAGAPFTLFSYCVEGGGSDDFRLARSLMATDPGLARDTLNVLADAAAELCLAQLSAGADAVQLFDTWGGLLTREDYRAFALPALNRAAAAIRKSGKPVMLFIKGGMHLLEVLRDVEVDGISLDWRTSFAEARRALPGKILQGQIDPVLLFASEAIVRERTKQLLSELDALPDGGAQGCIVNLGHGILPATPEANVAALCAEVAAHAH